MAPVSFSIPVLLSACVVLFVEPSEAEGPLNRRTPAPIPHVTTTTAPPSSTAPPCQDLIPNCSSFGSAACVGSHAVWALENCRRYCGLCDSDECQDKDVCINMDASDCDHANSNLRQYYRSNCPHTCGSCFDDFRCRDFLSACASLDDEICTDSRTQDWARRNCHAKCGYCIKSTLPPLPGKVDSSHPMPHVTTTTAPPSSTAPPCQDLIPNCSSFGSAACVGSHAVWALENCRRYCGLCVIEPSGCFDATNRCVQLDQKVCTDTRTRDWAQRYCPVMCGVCGKSSTTNPPSSGPSGSGATLIGHPVPHVTMTTAPPSSTAPPCQDLIPNCSSFGSAACVGSHAVWALENCRRYCGLCDSGMCEFGGNRYKTGERWFINCDYECMCIDGESGQYSCKSRCPALPLLPTCSAVRDPRDACCTIPMCDGALVFPPTNFPALGTSGSLNECRDNNHRCAALDKEVCSDNRTQEWAQSNCQRTCGFCTVPTLPTPAHLTGGPSLNPHHQPVSTPSPSPTPTPTRTDIRFAPCQDAIYNCGSYGSNVCRTHPEWSLYNCRQHCSYCAQCYTPLGTIVQGRELLGNGVRYRCEDACTSTYSVSPICPAIVPASVPSNCRLAVDGTSPQACQTVFCRGTSGADVNVLASASLMNSYGIQVLPSRVTNYTSNPLPSDFIALGGTLCD